MMAVRAETSRSLAGKAALVTGAARRLGRAAALALGAAGVHIVIHDHQTLHGDCEHVCEELGKLGVNSWIVTADFEDPSDYATLIERSLGVSGRLDILINNASIFVPDTIQDAGFTSAVRHLQINAWAPLVISRDFSRLAKSGKIINVLDSRVSGYDWRHFSYILSKLALRLVTEMTAIEFAPDISVNAVAPGLILPPPGKDIGYLEGLAKTVPLNRHGGTRDITDAMLFLLQSDFITGQIIYADGGRHLMEYDDGPHTDR